METKKQELLDRLITDYRDWPTEKLRAEVATHPIRGRNVDIYTRAMLVVLKERRDEAIAAIDAFAATGEGGRPRRSR
jgi:hypothetical protein